MTDAIVLTDRARPAVRLGRHLPDPPGVVWRALTEREQLEPLREPLLARSRPVLGHPLAPLFDVCSGRRRCSPSLGSKAAA